MIWAKVVTMTVASAWSWRRGGALGPVASDPAAARTVRAERFELVDAQGKVRGCSSRGRGRAGAGPVRRGGQGDLVRPVVATSGRASGPEGTWAMRPTGKGDL